MAVPATRTNLIEALVVADESSRIARVERIEWLSQHDPVYGVIVGDMTVMHMMGEARNCFIFGHFVGALLLATSFIEHVLSEELEGVVPEREQQTLQLMIMAARKNLSLPSGLLNQIDQLRVLRNPFVHRKARDNPHSFNARFLEEKKHPAAILEEDAKMAIVVMYELFRYTLRNT